MADQVNGARRYSRRLQHRSALSLSSMFDNLHERLTSTGEHRVKRRKVDDRERAVATPDTTLLIALQSQQWSECLTLLKREDAPRMVRYSEGQRNILHWAFSDGAADYNNQIPLDVLRAMHEVDPTLILGKGILREAIEHQSAEVVEFLLKTDPRTVSSYGTKGGSTPLHTAIWYGRPSSVVAKVLSFQPTAVRAANISGETPLSMLVGCAVRAVRDVDDPNFKRSFALLLWAYVHGTAMTDDEDDEANSSDGRCWLPHEALRHRSDADVPLSFLRKLVTASTRKECARPDAGGNFPLHLECLHSQTVSVLPSVEYFSFIESSSSSGSSSSSSSSSSSDSSSSDSDSDSEDEE